VTEVGSRKLCSPLVPGAYLFDGSQGGLSFNILAQFEINLIKLIVDGAILISRADTGQLLKSFLESAQLGERPPQRRLGVQEWRSPRKSLVQVRQGRFWIMLLHPDVAHKVLRGRVGTIE